MILDRYDALSLRERGLVLVAVLVVIYFLWTSIVSLPVADARQAAAEEQQRLSQRISQMALEEAALHQAAAEDPEQMLRRERDALRMELADLDEQLAELSLGLVSVHQLASVLEQVLVIADADILYNDNIPLSPTLAIPVGGGHTEPVFHFYSMEKVHLIAGRGLDYFKAPGAGNMGSFTMKVSPENYPWLTFDWDGDGLHDNGPHAQFNFGSYRGHDRVIYWREIFEIP